MDPLLRPYDAAADRDAVIRVWTEIGWLRRDPEFLDHWLQRADALVAEVDGAAEVLVTTHDATLRHGRTDLSMAAVTAVSVSRIARQGGLGSRLTALAMAGGAARGQVMTSLGIFDQGYYDRFGFGTGAYQRRYRFDPRHITVPVPERRPVRLGYDDWEDIHANRLAGRRAHGGCTVTDAGFMRGEMGMFQEGFGLGFRDEEGTLTHHAWFVNEGDPEHGPYTVEWFAFRTAAELRELFGLLRALGDQVHLVDVPEHAGVQVQRLLDRPLRANAIGTATERPGGRVLGWWQFRPLDLAAAVAAVSLPGDPVTFTLELDDPVVGYLPPETPWRGIGGHWTVTLGPESSAEPGGDARRPSLRCGVATFSRLWLGVVPAAMLPVTDDLDAPESLLEELDRLVVLPDPQPDWPF